MCGVVCILLYFVLYQSSLWLPDFNQLLVLSCQTTVFISVTVYHPFSISLQTQNTFSTNHFPHSLPIIDHPWTGLLGYPAKRSRLSLTLSAFEHVI